MTLAGDREIFCGLDALMCFTGVHLLELSSTERSSLSLLCPAVREMYLDLKEPLRTTYHFRTVVIVRKNE